jgi:glycosyltransferase involved in cell wall biosynthesis
MMRISVYIPSYNQKAYLIEAIESVLAQTLRPHQVIIVDDASADGSQEVIAGYASRYPDWITPIYHTQNQGVVAARNDALQAVTGDYVTYVDGDDRYLPAKLEVEAGCLDAALGSQLVYSNYYLIDEQGQRLDQWASGSLPEGDIFCQVFGRQFPRRRLFRSELVHYASWQQVGFYDPRLRVFEDYDMRIRLTHHLRAAYTKQALSEYRLLGTGLSKLAGQVYLQAFEYIRQKNLPLLASRPFDQQRQVSRQLDQWQAALLRRMGRQALHNRSGQAAGRAQAFQYYRTSLKYHRTLDALFWLEFILSPQGYRSLKRLYHTLKRSRLQNEAEAATLDTML